MIANNIFIRNFTFLIYGLISFTVFYLILKLSIPTDIQLHIKILHVYLANGLFPTPPLYYQSVKIIDRLIGNYDFIRSSILILTIACLAKYQITNLYFREKIDTISFPSLVIFSLMFVAPLAVSNFDKLYLGKFTSTIWHNSTSIFVFPLSLLLFLCSLKYLHQPTLKRIIVILLISLLVLLAKPSFLFPFVIVFPLISLLKFGISKRLFWYTVGTALIIFVCMMWQKQVIYKSSVLDKLIYNSSESKVYLAPFRVWLSWTKNPAWSIISSFLIVISFALLKFREYKKDIDVIFAFLLVLFSLLIFFVLAESGPRFNHGNFYWQIPISIFILHMVLIKKLIFQPEYVQNGHVNIAKVLKNNILISFCYAVQFISGLIYTGRIIVEGNYL